MDNKVYVKTRNVAEEPCSEKQGSPMALLMNPEDSNTKSAPSGGRLSSLSVRITKLCDFVLILLSARDDVWLLPS